MAHSRSFLANQKARNAIVGAENLLKAIFSKKKVKIKTGDEKRRVDDPWDDFQEKVNEIYNYKYNLGCENVQQENM